MSGNLVIKTSTMEVNNINKISKGQKKLFAKVGLIIFLTFLMLIPQVSIQDLIRERQGLEQGVKFDIYSSWGGMQYLSGPVISIPYQSTIMVDDKIKVTNEFLHVLPEQFKVNADLSVSEKKRSIYEVLLYKGKIDILATYNLPSQKAFPQQATNILYGASHMSIGISDPKGITDVVYARQGDKEYKFSSGTISPHILSNGLSTIIELEEKTEKLEFIITIQLNGAEAFYVSPSGAQSILNVKSDWSDPSFEGGILPLSSDSQNDGFIAEWKSNEYHRNTPGYWLNNTYSLNNQKSHMGTRLIKTANNYQKNTRSAKYAMLIISLTFILFFFFEIFGERKVHPIQYTFIGVSLSIFYFLLLSLSEHIGFNYAYLASAHATITLIAFYSYYILKNIKSIMVLIFSLSSLYAYLFIILQMETYALLTGSIGLFVVLGIIMFLSRNVDWYHLGKAEN